jgi:polyhydroxyalkanoate synthesis regulator phasin
MTNIDRIKETASTAEKMIKDNAATAEEMARKVWLAGLGAYGKGYEELTGRIETLSSESNKLFDELVAKGAKLESEGKQKFEGMKNDLKAKTEVDARIETARTNNCCC